MPFEYNSENWNVVDIGFILINIGICVWYKKHCNSLTNDDSNEINSLLKKGRNFILTNGVLNMVPLVLVRCLFMDQMMMNIDNKYLYGLIYFIIIGFFALGMTKYEEARNLNPPNSHYIKDEKENNLIFGLFGLTIMSIFVTYRNEIDFFVWKWIAIPIAIISLLLYLLGIDLS